MIVVLSMCAFTHRRLNLSTSRPPWRHRNTHASYDSVTSVTTNKYLRAGAFSEVGCARLSLHDNDSEIR
jgi:hypothetical protein